MLTFVGKWLLFLSFYQIMRKEKRSITIRKVKLFGTSIAVSTVPMAQEMDSDAELAGQLVVWTTVISAITLFVFIYLLRVIGIF